MLKSLLAATILVSAVSTDARAEPLPPRRVVVMHASLTYDRAEAASAEGSRALVARIDRTARSLCRRKAPSIPDRHLASRIAECRARAVERAVAEINTPLVIAAYAERNARR